jgi:cold shock protein
MYPRRPTFFRVENAPAGHIVEATVKWFDAGKGFGFVSLPEGGDAFLPAAALRRAGIAEARDGTVIRCEVSRGAKGPLVVHVLALRDAGAASRARTIDGAVKWFAAEKGYGFIAPDRGGKDVFVHINVMRRSGIEALAAGQRVRLELVQGRRRPEAERLRLL